MGSCQPFFVMARQLRSSPKNDAAHENAAGFFAETGGVFGVCWLIF